MLIKADAAQLEWRTKAYLAQCPVAIQEIHDLAWKPKDQDLHADNKNRFNLPSRTIAKNFLYRLIFIDSFSDRGFDVPAGAYSNDADFMHVSTSRKFWVDVVTRFFDKYPTIYSHGVTCIRTAVETGRIVSPSGRFYEFKQVQRYNGWDWPRSDILNYPVQGLAADFMMITRRLAWKSIKAASWYDPKRVLFMSTVHDDIEMDVDNDMDLVYNICIALENAFKDTPAEFERQFGVEVNVPLAGEVKLGWDLFEKNMTEFKKDNFQTIWDNVLTKRPL